jgi:hypothetical protein
MSKYFEFCSILGGHYWSMQTVTDYAVLNKVKPEEFKDFPRKLVTFRCDECGDVRWAGIDRGRYYRILPGRNPPYQEM